MWTAENAGFIPQGWCRNLLPEAHRYQFRLSGRRWRVHSSRVMSTLSSGSSSLSVPSEQQKEDPLLERMFAKHRQFLGLTKNLSVNMIIGWFKRTLKNILRLFSGNLMAQNPIKTFDKDRGATVIFGHHEWLMSGTLLVKWGIFGEISQTPHRLDFFNNQVFCKRDLKNFVLKFWSGIYTSLWFQRRSFSRGTTPGTRNEHWG